jgi:hypothetical protein
MIDLERMAKQVLLEKQKEADPNVYQTPFFHRSHEIAIIGSVFNI